MSYSKSLGILELERRQHAVETADEGVRALAQLRVDEGNAAFQAGNYELANRRYDEAFILLPTANMLIIIGLNMLRLGRYRDASYRFLRYLRENPDGARRGQAQELLAEAQVAMEREAASGGAEMVFTTPEAGAASVPAGPAPAPPAEIPPDVLAAKRAAIQSARQVQQQAPPPTSIRNPYAPPPYGLWAATGIGIAAVIGLGAYFIFKTPKTPKKKAAPKKNRRRRRRRS